MEKEYVGIRQAVKGGYIKCEVGGVADFLYPTSKHRRGRVQGNGQISPTITAENTGICRVEKVKKAECIGNLYEREGQAGNVFMSDKCSPCVPGFGGGGGGKEMKIVEKESYKRMNQTMQEKLSAESIPEDQVKNYKALDEQNQMIRQETFGTLTTDGSSPKHNNRVVEIEKKKAEHQIELDEENKYYDYLFDGVYYPSEDVTKGDEYADWSATEYRIRKLTPKECYRLMDVSEQDADKMLSINSQTQCYKQAGNSIVVSVLCAIFSQFNIQGIKPWNERSIDEKKKLTALGN